MRILDRHVLSECGVAAAMATAVFVFVLMAGNVLQQVMGAVSSGRVEPFQALEMVALLFPAVLPYALPMGLLTGIMIAFGRLSADGEIDAMRSTGLTLFRIALPVWIAAAAVTLFAVWLNLEAGPGSEFAFQKILVGTAGDNPASLIVPGKLNRQFKGLLIRAEGKEGQVLTGLRLWEVAADGTITKTLRATKARLEVVPGPEGSPLLRIHLSQARLVGSADEPGRPLRPVAFESAEQAVLEYPWVDSNPGIRFKRLRMMTGGELVDGMEHGWQVPPSAPAPERERERSRLAVQLMFRISMAVSIFALALLAVPLAVLSRRSEMSPNAVMALGVALAYYLLTSMATWIKEPSLHPEAWIMAPVLIVVLLACWLILRSSAR